MRCSNPFVKDGRALACGQCPPCRLNRKRIWTHRILLESKLHQFNTYVTLTYSDEHIPSLGSLEPLHLQLFLKRLRKMIQPLRVRYFAVGEYGDESFRPHYHAALFNFETCRRSRTYRRPGSSRPLAFECCDRCRLVSEAWGLGDVDLGTLEESSAQYVAGYVTKKMTHRLDPRLAGREPEFSRMSLKPGIGLMAMHEVASEELKYGLPERRGDVPSALRHGRKLLPLGSYLTRNLRKFVGRDEKTPQSVLDEQQEKMRAVRESAFNNSRSLKEEVIEASKTQVASMVQRAEIFKQRKKL